MNVYFDNNTLANLAQAGVDPVAALAGSELTLAVTPDPATEYRQGIKSGNTTKLRRICAGSFSPQQRSAASSVLQVQMDQAIASQVSITATGQMKARSRHCGPSRSLSAPAKQSRRTVPMRSLLRWLRAPWSSRPTTAGTSDAHGRMAITSTRGRNLLTSITRPPRLPIDSARCLANEPQTRY